MKKISKFLKKTLSKKNKTEIFIKTLILFCLYIFVDSIFPILTKESVFLFKGSEEAVGRVTDIKEIKHRGRYSDYSTYRIKYEFTTKNNFKIIQEIDTLTPQRHFIKYGDDLPILYQEFRNEIFSRPKSAKLTYIIFKQTILVFTMFFFLILIIRVRNLKTEKLFKIEIFILNKKLLPILYLAVITLLFFLSIDYYIFYSAFESLNIYFEILKMGLILLVLFGPTFLMNEHKNYYKNRGK